MTSEATSSHDATPDPSHPVLPGLGAYLAAYAALLCGLAATVGLAYVPLGSFNVVAMLAVAGSKAAIVVLVFMHVRHAPGLVRLAVAAGVIWFTIMIAFAMSDYLTREWIPTRTPAHPAAQVKLDDPPASGAFE